MISLAASLSMILMIRRKLRSFRYVISAGIFILMLDFVLNHQSSYPLVRSAPNIRQLGGIRSVYIASTQWNSGELLQKHWIPNLVQVIDALRVANISVFVSIYENGSWDSTKSVLRQLEQILNDKGVKNQIELANESHEEIIARHDSKQGWLNTAYGAEMRRIPYLASVRNKALEHLSNSSTTYDRLLYINDVVFSVGLDSSGYQLQGTNRRPRG